MYKEDFVAVIKVNKKIVREMDGGKVKLPFNTEYTIALKNKRFCRCVVDIFIDGKFIGKSLCLLGHQEVNLERFLDCERKFKFIQKTKQIQEHRGDKIDDGIITIKFRYENPAIVVKKPQDVWYDSLYGDIYRADLPTHYYSPKVGSGDVINADSTYLSTNQPINMASRSITDPNDDEGITVKGSHSNQRFYECAVVPLESEVHEINFQLIGYHPTESEKDPPIFVTSKVTCAVCGNRSCASAKFCSECGSALN